MLFPVALNRRASLSAMKVSFQTEVFDGLKIEVMGSSEADLPLRQLIGCGRRSESCFMTPLFFRPHYL